jgi:hypothetical protein
LLSWELSLIGDHFDIFYSRKSTPGQVGDLFGFTNQIPSD